MEGVASHARELLPSAGVVRPGVVRPGAPRAAARDDDAPMAKAFAEEYLARGRGLHSSTSQLNLSALYGIGGARRGSVARVKGVFGGV